MFQSNFRLDKVIILLYLIGLLLIYQFEHSYFIFIY